MLEARDKYFSPDMPVAEAMVMHSRVAEVFAAFNLGGCGSCSIAQFETIAQVCVAYGVDVTVLLEVLEGLMQDEKAPEKADSPAKQSNP